MVIAVVADPEIFMEFPGYDDLGAGRAFHPPSVLFCNIENFAQNSNTSPPTIYATFGGSSATTSSIYLGLM
jgi:hypothetical protein